MAGCCGPGRIMSVADLHMPAVLVRKAADGAAMTRWAERLVAPGSC